jgi:hypothetical protein
MAQIGEAVGAGSSPLASVQRAGLEVLDRQQTVRFTKYYRLVLPLDGYVFWVRADLVTPSAIYNDSPLNTYFFDQAKQMLPTAETLDVKGSFHYSQTNQQAEDESFAVNRVIFTAEYKITDLNNVMPNEMWLGTFGGVRFSFSQRSGYYVQADIHHYSGDAVYPIMDQLIIDSLEGFDPVNVVVSNSLPAWLTLNRVCPVYPSFLLPDNLPTPYIAAHVIPEETHSIQPVPYIDLSGSHWQLARDRVRLTFYGLRNFNAVDWLDQALAFIGYDGEVLGLMNGPIIRDEKRTQAEIGVIAMKKTIEFEVSYYQQRVRDLALQYIKSCVPTFYIQDWPNPLIV